MKKILIAAAVVGVFAGTAQAQTNVTLFGVADAAVRFDRTNAGTLRGLSSGELAGSRWGIRGSEDVGGGLRVNFHYEQAVSVDTGAATGFTRTAFVGMSGGFGNVRAGVEYTPLYRAWSFADAFARGTVGKALNVAAFQTNSGVGAGIRFSNAVYYDSPNMSGFLFRAAYQFGEGTTAATKSVNNAYSLGGVYSAGPIVAGLGYERWNIAGGAHSRMHSLAGAYDFKVARLHAGYLQRKTSNGAVNSNAYTIGVSAPVGAARLFAQFSNYNDKTAANADSKGYGIGGRYALSRRTDFYGAWGRLTNNSNAANFIPGGLQNAGNTNAGSNPSAFEVGINHRF
jgi:GBP family porin